MTAFENGEDTSGENSHPKSGSGDASGAGDAFDLSGFSPEPGAAPKPAPPRDDKAPPRRRPAASGNEYGGARRGSREGAKPGAFRREGSSRGDFSRTGGDRYGAPPRRDFSGKGGERRGFGPKPFDRGSTESIAPEVGKFLPLKHEKGRYRESRFLIEGAKNVADAVAISPDVIHCVLMARDFTDAKLTEIFRRQRIRVQEVHHRDLAALCDTETPQGIVAVANFAALRPDWNSARSVTLLDGIQDPGNLGSILRTSAALGMDAVVLGKGTCDAYNPKVVRSSAASLLRLPLETGEDLGAKIHFLRTKGFSVVATSPHAKLTLAQAKLRKKVALLFGNEGAGVGENLLDQADARVRIPMRGKVESLNVAVAHGLLTYELMRVRGEL